MPTYAEARTGDFDYRIYTPWKLNISAATTVGNWLAVDAEYEVSRYSGAQVRYPNAYDWGDYNVSSHKDRALCEEIDRWILSCLHSLIKDVTANYEAYEPTKVGRAISDFLQENLSFLNV